MQKEYGNSILSSLSQEALILRLFLWLHCIMRREYCHIQTRSCSCTPRYGPGLCVSNAVPFVLRTHFPPLLSQGSFLHGFRCVADWSGILMHNRLYPKALHTNHHFQRKLFSFSLETRGGNPDARSNILNAAETGKRKEEESWEETSTPGQPREAEEECGWQEHVFRRQSGKSLTLIYRASGSLRPFQNSTSDRKTFLSSTKREGEHPHSLSSRLLSECRIFLIDKREQPICQPTVCAVPQILRSTCKFIGARRLESCQQADSSSWEGCIIQIKPYGAKSKTELQSIVGIHGWSVFPWLPEVSREEENYILFLHCHH